MIGLTLQVGNFGCISICIELLQKLQNFCELYEGDCNYSLVGMHCQFMTCILTSFSKNVYPLFSDCVN